VGGRGRYDLLPVAKTPLSPHVSYPRDGQQGRLIGTVVPVPCHMPPDGIEAFRTVQGRFPVRSSPPLDQAFDMVFEAMARRGRYVHWADAVAAAARRGGLSGDRMLGLLGKQFAGQRFGPPPLDAVG
jgi:hypothetical protein